MLDESNVAEKFSPFVTMDNIGKIMGIGRVENSMESVWEREECASTKACRSKASDAVNCNPKVVQQNSLVWEEKFKVLFLKVKGKNGALKEIFCPNQKFLRHFSQ